ncbi:MAG: dihydrolipoamide acetyltransferase family protein [Spirochaetota bacterium]
MAESVLMMALSPTMDEGVIAEWIVKEGQAVKSGDVLCEVETDKATMAYEASAAGTLLKILKPAGSKAAVGEAIAIIGKAGEDWQAVAGALASSGGRKATASRQEAGQALEIPALPARQLAPSSTTVSSAFPAVPPAGSGAKSVENTQKHLRQDQRSGSGPLLRSGYPPSSPLARRKVAEAGLDLRALRGSGPSGRVVARDVDDAMKAGITRRGLADGQESPTVGGSAQSSMVGGKSAAPTSAQAGTKAGLHDERVPLSRMRTIIAQRLSASYTTAPHFYVRTAVDMERLVALRTSLNAGRDRGLGLNAFILKLVATTLERHPIINASWEDDAIRFRGSADIGLAVALEGGLITPVVRSCENLGIAAIDSALADLIPRARAGGLALQEYSNASFSISNLGSYGIEEFTAIINPPGSAILALGGMAEEAVVRDGAVVARRIMHLTLSCDHRVIDGAAAAAFMAELKAMMEEPARALL